MCGCLGSKSVTRSPAPSAPRGSSPQRRPFADEVVLRYVGKIALLVKGPVSNRAYALRPAARISCDRRDVPSFLASPLFERLDRRQSSAG